MMESRRNALRSIDVQLASHAGLWLDRFMHHQLEDQETVPPGSEVPTHRLVKEAASVAMPAAYGAFYQRWQSALEARGAIMRTATVDGRMIVGLGEENALETSVTLHHTYGVPVIPGSALKGLAARYARQCLDHVEWGPNSVAYKVLFGTTDEAGYVIFFDALYVPDSGPLHRPLHADVMTVHHKGYYGGSPTAPADWDDPNPIPFVSAAGRYLLAIAGPSVWVAAGYEILGLALKEMGIGAKTSSGYGRLVLAPALLAVSPQAQSLLSQIKALTPAQVPSQIGGLADRWEQLDAADKRLTAQAIVDKVAAAKWKKAAEKSWYQEMLSLLQLKT